MRREDGGSKEEWSVKKGTRARQLGRALAPRTNDQLLLAL